MAYIGKHSRLGRRRSARQAELLELAASAAKMVSAISPLQFHRQFYSGFRPPKIQMNSVVHGQLKITLGLWSSKLQFLRIGRRNFAARLFTAELLAAPNGRECQTCRKDDLSHALHRLLPFMIFIAFRPFHHMTKTSHEVVSASSH